MKVKLSDVFTLQMGKTPSRKNRAYWEGTHKWISIADLGNATRIIYTTKEAITDVGVSASGIKVVPAGTVVMSFKLSIGKTAITAEDMYTNEAIMAFIDKKKYPLDTGFFYHLCSGTDWSAGTNKAVMGLTLNKATLSEFEISLPDLSTQKEIAQKLDKIDETIALHKLELDSLNELVKSRFIELFGDPRSNPNNYDKKRLGDTCNVITGNTPSRSVDAYYGDYIEWIKTDNIVAGRLNPSFATEKLSEEGMSVGRIVDENAILMVCIAGSIASIGRVCITDRKVTFNQQINAIEPQNYDVIFLYVLLQISKEYLVEDINMALKGILSKSRLQDKEFIVPPIEDQRVFAAFVAQTDKSKLAVQENLQELETLKKSLMQEYFG